MGIRAPVTESSPDCLSCFVTRDYGSGLIDSRDASEGSP